MNLNKKLRILISLVLLLSVIPIYFGQTTYAVENVSWEVVGSPGMFGNSFVEDIEVAVSSNGTIYMAAADTSNTVDELVVMEYTGSGDTDTGWELVGNKIEQKVNEIDMVLYGETIYLAYQDYESASADGLTVVSYTKGISSDWQVVGERRFTNGYAYHFSIDVDSSGNLYVAYRDMADETDPTTYGRGTVMKFNGTIWETVGTAGFTGTNAEYLSLALDSQDNIYVAYKVMSDSDKARVMKYDGTAWSFVGNPDNPGMSPGAAMFVDLNINSQDELYVAFQDRENSYEGTVMKYDGSSWTVVGGYGITSGFSASNVEYTDVEFDNEDNVYLGYSAQREYVLKYDGTWQSVGTAPVNSEYYSDMHSTFVYNRTIYIGFRDEEYGGRVTVMKYSEPVDQTIDLSSIDGIQPTIDAAPATTIDTIQYTGVVSWIPNDETFGYETIYTAEVILTPKDGYTLSGVTENFFNVQGAETTTNAADSGAITATFITSADWQAVGGSFTDFYTDLLGSEDHFYIETLDVTSDSQGIPYVGMTYKIVLGDDTEGPWQSSVCRYFNGSWENLGNLDDTTAAAQFINIEMGNNDLPVVAYYYQDTSTGYIKVKQWDGDVWNSLGYTSNVGSHSPSVFDFAVSGDSIYLAYGDYDSSATYGSLTVIGYSSELGDWSPIGSKGLSETLAWDINLAIDSDGIPCVSFMEIDDSTNVYRHIVKCFDSTGWTWTTLRSTSYEFTESYEPHQFHSDIKLDSSNVLYTAFSNPDAGYELTVEKWNEDSWETVGNSNFTDDFETNLIRFVDLEIDSDDTPIVAVSHNLSTPNIEYIYKYMIDDDLWIPLKSNYFSAYFDGTGLVPYRTNAFYTYSVYENPLWHGYLLEYLPVEQVVPGGSGGGSGGSSGAVDEGEEIIIRTIDGNMSVTGIMTNTDSRMQVEITAEAFAEIEQTDQDILIDTGSITVSFDKKAVDHINSLADSDGVRIIINEVDSLDLAEVDQVRVGDRPVYDFTLFAGDTQITNFDGKATINIPYTLKDGENPNAVVIYYVDNSGNLKTARGKYCAETETVVFTVMHFSIYAVGYNQISFNDVVPGSWYKDAVDFIAARGITSGTSVGEFSPEAKLTRGQFIVLLMNAYGISPDADDEGTANFVDAGSTYYTSYLLEAKSLGIVNGVGNNMFAPEQAITRQEMFVMLYNALEVIEELPQANGSKQLPEFIDANQVASWAQEAVNALIEGGVISGSNGMLTPTVSTTRAQMAQMLYNLLSK